MIKKKLKIGLLTESDTISAWAYSSLEKIIGSQSAEITLVMQNQSSASSQSFIRRLWNARKRIGYYIYNSLSRKLFSGSPDAFKIQNLNALILDVPVMKIQPIEKKYSDYFEKDDVEKIKEYDLDIIIRMGFRILKGEILTSCSKYGVWSHHHGDNHFNRGGPPGYWETVDGWPTTGSILQILSEDLDGGKILYRSWSLTNPSSLAKNRHAYYWTSASFLSRQIKRLYQLGPDQFFQEIEKFNDPFDFYSNKLLKAPSNLYVIKHSTKMILIFIKRIWQKMFFIDQWSILFRIEKGIAKSFHRFKEIKPPKDRFWADPHVIFKDEKYFIFVEEYLYSTKLGRLAVIEVDKNGNASDVKTVLEKDYHLSYPNVFELNGTYYMIPETSANHTIDLYECTKFPDKWEFKMTLMKDIDAVDSTLLFKENKWWLFANVAENLGASKNDELFLFYSDDLFSSDWTVHPQNPIISDTTHSRPAGKIISHNEKLYRPSQDCSGIYGRGFNVSEILEISEMTYSEKIVETIYSNWNDDLLGTHCFNAEAGITVIDAFTRRRKYC